jgi:hypothetical protein
MYFLCFTLTISIVHLFPKLSKVIQIFLTLFEPFLDFLNKTGFWIVDHVSKPILPAD